MTDGQLPTFMDDRVRCPFCGSPNDAVTGVSGPDAPSDGDLILCVDCVQPGILEGETIRRPTDVELAQALALPEYRAAVSTVLSLSDRRQ